MFKGTNSRTALSPSPTTSQTPKAQHKLESPTRLSATRLEGWLLCPVASFMRSAQQRVTQNVGVTLLMAIVHAGGVEGSLAAYRPAWTAWMLVIVLQALTCPWRG